jgi:hypothetical protein
VTDWLELSGGGVVLVGVRLVTLNSPGRSLRPHLGEDWRSRIQPGWPCRFARKRRVPMRLGAVAVEVVAGSSAEDLQLPWPEHYIVTTMSCGELMAWVTAMLSCKRSPSGRSS